LSFRSALRTTIPRRISVSLDLSVSPISLDQASRSASSETLSISTSLRLKASRLTLLNFDFLKTFNKDKKLVKKWAKQYAMLLASDSLVKKIPTVLGPILNRIGMFPQVVIHNEDLKTKVDDSRASIKFQLKKVTCLAVAIGNEKMTEDELRKNISMGVNFLASLLKKGWHNLKSVHIKNIMGKPFKLFG
jgi:large subunit ribosomal protein L10Ae